MITSFYAALLACVIVWLSLRVIKLRHGGGGVPELEVAIRA